MGNFNSLTGCIPSFANDFKKFALLPAFGFGFWLLAFGFAVHM
jgi:hypothetical protein